MTLKMLTELEKERIKKFHELEDNIRWRTNHQLNKKINGLVNDLIFLLENGNEIGPLQEIVGEEKIDGLIKGLIRDVGLEHSLMTPTFAVSIIEENRMLANIISKKNKVWRDLLAKVNTADNMEKFVKEIISNENVYLVDEEKVRVHIRREHNANKGRKG